MLTLIGCSRVRHKVQNDLNDWIIDEKGKPIKPIDFKIYEKQGLPIPDPADIPAEKTSFPVDVKEKAREKKAKAH